MFYSKLEGGFYDAAIHGDSIPADCVEITTAEHAALMSGQAAGLRITADAEGRPVLADQPPATPAQLQAMFVAAIQQRLDAFAQTRGYDGILSACTYATDPDPQLQAEGQACVILRSATWRAGYLILAAVQSGQRPMPTVDEVLAELPDLEWPPA